MDCELRRAGFPKLRVRPRQVILGDATDPRRQWPQARGHLRFLQPHANDMSRAVARTTPASGAACTQHSLGCAQPAERGCAVHCVHAPTTRRKTCTRCRACAPAGRAEAAAAALRPESRVHLRLCRKLLRLTRQPELSLT
eukprot:3292361-Rhodomonas_salina.1